MNECALTIAPGSLNECALTKCPMLSELMSASQALWRASCVPLFMTMHHYPHTNPAQNRLVILTHYLKGLSLTFQKIIKLM